jgi:uncharacterized protein (DUF1501 family)
MARTTEWKIEMTRRALLRLGLTGAAMAALPFPFHRSARAEAGDPHLVVTFYAEGGWDTTQVLDVHDPADTTDGIDVDVLGQPLSQIATAGPLTYISNPATRPNVDPFFQHWADRTAIVNGINTRSTSHDQSRQLMATGYLDPTRADFAVMAAAANGPSLPLPHILLSGPSWGGPFAGLSGRVGGQLSQALAYNRLGDNGPLAVSAVGEAFIQQALTRQHAVDPALTAGAIAGKAAAFDDAQARGDQLARLGGALRNINQGNPTQLASAIANAFRQGLTTSVTLSQVGGFDTHTDNTQQNGRWNSLFGFLDPFLTQLAAEPGLAHSSLLDETTVIYFSEFARTPELNGNTPPGKDHHPWTSVMVIGKNVAPGVYGQTDDTQVGVKTNFKTGRPDDAGMVIDVTNLIAGLLTVAGANPKDYLPAGVLPFTAFVA